MPITQRHSNGPEEDEWSFRKWFSGFLSGKRYGKDLAILVRMAILIILISLIAVGVRWVWGEFKPKDKPMRPDVVTAETANIDKSSTTINETNMPFSWGLFGVSSKKNERND